MLTRQDGKLDVTRMSALVDQIAWLRQQDIEVILVSSGAMASGRGELKVDHSLDSVERFPNSVSLPEELKKNPVSFHSNFIHAHRKCPALFYFVPIYSFVPLFILSI